MPSLRSSVPLVFGLLLLSCSSPTTPSTTSGPTSRESVVSTQSRAATETLTGVDLADVIDALFLGSGPFVAPGAQTQCPVQRVWAGFPRGTVVRVRVASVVAPEAQVAMRQALTQVATATRGAVRPVMEETPDLDPVPDTDEVTVTSMASPQAVGCRADWGCVQNRFRGHGILRSTRIVEGPARGAIDYVRDVVGRGVLGMCQINGRRVSAAGGSLMSVDPSFAFRGLTPLDLEATTAVYGSTLAPGASRNDFVRAGLVHLHAGK